jgi:hypothetical protein
MPKKHLILVLLVMLMVPTIAQSDGIPLQKDVFLEYPITTTEDLPDQITFNLYDSKTTTTPIATQTFPKGKYTVDFEFSKSDAVTPGTVAKFKAQEGRHR